jgi:sporulation protein YlmC with PRC-barrel domain
MILTTGMPAIATDGPCGEVADIVVDPITWKVTHLVIEPAHHHDHSRLVPIGGVTWTDEAVALSLSIADVSNCPPVQETDFIPLETWPDDKGSWAPGISRVLSWPYYPYYGDLGATGYIGYPYGYGSGLGWGGSPVVTMSYDRLPKDTVEVRRASEVMSSDNHKVGHVDGFAVDANGKITHLILEHGHLWGHRDISIPLDDISTVASDRVQLKVMRDAIGEYPSVPFRRHTLAV